MAASECVRYKGDDEMMCSEVFRWRVVASDDRETPPLEREL